MLLFVSVFVIHFFIRECPSVSFIRGIRQYPSSVVSVNINDEPEQKEKYNNRRDVIVEKNNPVTLGPAA